MPISKLVQLMVRNRQQILNITDEGAWITRRACTSRLKRIIDQQQQSTHQQQPPVAVADILIPVFIGEETDLLSERFASRLAWAPPSPAECRYYATRMRFRLREYSAFAWPVFYGQDNILVERKFYTNVRAEYCGPRTPASKLAGCLATLDGHELILTPVWWPAGRSAQAYRNCRVSDRTHAVPCAPGALPITTCSMGPILSAVRIEAREKRCRAFTLMSLHEGLGGGGADVGGSGGFLGHTIVFPKKEEDQFKTAMRILDELGRSPNRSNRHPLSADWSQAERPASNILRLIYQGRFLHRSVTLAALRLPPGGTTVMHLVARDSAPEPRADGERTDDHYFVANNCPRFVDAMKC
uniref:Rad60-SLD_2 domain-containing protein n=1 Tax=Macrostomum lignano TaxID=282301 RepID=A0A1I8FEJ8_9PLAT